MKPTFFLQDCATTHLKQCIIPKIFRRGTQDLFQGSGDGNDVRALGGKGCDVGSGVSSGGHWTTAPQPKLFYEIRLRVVLTVERDWFPISVGHEQAWRCISTIVNDTEMCYHLAVSDGSSTDEVTIWRVGKGHQSWLFALDPIGPKRSRRST